MADEISVRDKVSIIIPVYNVEKYISQCIDSCINQSYKNFEIILIDDGSIDESGNICDQYGEIDERIQVIHQNNQGLSVARNKGMLIANGEYLLFVDSDDRISKDCLKATVSTMQNTKSDIVFFDYERIVGARRLGHENFLQGEKALNTFECLELLLQHKMGEIVWNGIYRKSIVSDIEFPVNKQNEDVFWKYKAISKAKKITWIPACLYYYRIHGDSITGRPFSRKWFDELEGKYLRALDIARVYPDLKNLAYSEVLASCMVTYERVLENFVGEEKVQAISEIKCLAKKFPLKLYASICDHRIPRMRKITIVLSKISFKWAIILKAFVVRIKYKKEIS